MSNHNTANERKALLALLVFGTLLIVILEILTQGWVEAGKLICLGIITFIVSFRLGTIIARAYR